MTTTEQIVEAYFRICRSCFTIADLKVPRGNCRQLDLLAFRIDNQRQYHVEVSVSHSRQWQPSFDKLIQRFEHKFFGEPKSAEYKSSSDSDRIRYYSAIQKAYRSVGLDAFQIQRVWVTWEMPKEHDFQDRLRRYCDDRGIADRPIEIVSFREKVIPQLSDAVGTANHSDHSLRILSLLGQCKIQLNVARQRKDQRNFARDDAEDDAPQTSQPGRRDWWMKLTLEQSIARFGADAKAKLSNRAVTGEPEDQYAPRSKLSSPISRNSAASDALRRSWRFIAPVHHDTPGPLDHPPLRSGQAIRKNQHAAGPVVEWNGK
jgi:hypothetical protein